MSVYREVQTEISDQECLEDALKQVRTRTGKNWEPEVHSQPQKLEGYEGKLRDQKAEIIVRRRQVGGAANDIGFVKGEDGRFRAIISDYDKHYYNDQWLGELKAAYAEKKVMKEAKRNGFTFLGKKQVGTKTRLQFTKA